MPGHKFRIIGDTDLENLKSEIHYRNICNVNLLPPVSRDKLVKEYENADILFLHLKDVLHSKESFLQKFSNMEHLTNHFVLAQAVYLKSFLKKILATSFFLNNIHHLV